MRQAWKVCLTRSGFLAAEALGDHGGAGRGDSAGDDIDHGIELAAHRVHRRGNDVVGIDLGIDKGNGAGDEELLHHKGDAQAAQGL